MMVSDGLGLVIMVKSGWLVIKHHTTVNDHGLHDWFKGRVANSGG